MAELTLDSIDLELAQDAEGDPVLIGEQSRAYAGNLRSSIRGQKRVWSAMTGYLDTTDKEALLAAVYGETHITGSGDLLGGSLTVSVKATAQKVAGISPVLWSVALAIQEV